MGVLRWKRILGASPSGFNGGRSQVNLNYLQGGGDYPFLNHYKNGQTIGSSVYGTPRPCRLNAQGYPTVLDPGEEILNVFFVPRQEDRPGDYVLLWDGPTGSQVGLPFTQIAVEGSTVIESGTSGRYRFSTSSFRFEIRIKTVGITNVRVVHVDDEEDLASGKVFGKQFLKRLKDGNFGVIRFLNWHGGNEPAFGQWKHNKPLDYSVWGSTELRPGIYAGHSSLSGSDYSVGDTPDGFVLEDRTMVIVKIVSSSGGSAPYTLDVNETGAKRLINKFGGDFNPGVGIWSAIYDATLDGFMVDENGGGGGGIYNGVPIELTLMLCAELGAHPHYVCCVFASEENNDYWPLGMATYLRDNKPDWMIPRQEGPNEEWNISGAVNQLWWAWAIQRVRNGGTSAYTVTSMTYPSPASGTGYADMILTDVGSLQIGSTVYPSGFDGQGTLTSFDGWNANVSAFNVDENPNKITIKTAARFLSGAVTGATGGTIMPGQYENHEHYGRAIAQIGKAYSDVFGGDPKAGDKYKILIGVQTAYGSSPGDPNSHDQRFDSPQWVIQGHTAAKDLATHGAVANYYNPLDQWTLAELEDAFDYNVTSRDEPTTRTTLISNYVDSTDGSLTDLRTVKYPNWKNYLVSKGIDALCCYEGGFSPDFVQVMMPTSGAFLGSLSAIVGATKASSCVLMLGTTYLRGSFISQDTFYQFASTNPIKPGMLLHLRDVAGMTELNCDIVDGNATLLSFTDNSADITYGGAIVPKVGQGILFQPVNNYYGTDAAGRFPTPLEMYVPYYVVYSSDTTIRVSLTKGGSPITITNGASVFWIGAVTGWVVLSKSDSSIAIDCNSTAFTTWMSGGNQFAYVAASDAYLNIYRCDAKRSPELQAKALTSLVDVNNVTGDGFVGEFGSNYLLSGLKSEHYGDVGYDSDVWSIENDIFAPESPQFAAAVEFNH